MIYKLVMTIIIKLLHNYKIIKSITPIKIFYNNTIVYKVTVKILYNVKQKFI